MDGGHGRTGKLEGEATTSSMLSADAKEFVPATVLDLSNYASDESEAMVEVNGSIVALLNSPEMFYEVANDLAVSLSKSVADDDIQIGAVVKTLFDVSVSEDNFRYSGARLLSFLCEHLPEDIGRKFRSKLLNTCKDLYSQHEQLVDEAPSVLIQFTLFMAEVTCSLMINGCVIEIFPSCLLDLLASVLVIGSDESIKGFVQTLKLTGAVLERHNSARLEELFTDVKKKVADDTSSTTQRMLLLSVVELKAASWLAVGDSSPAEQDDEPPTSTAVPDDTAGTLQDVIEYSDDDDDAAFSDRNFDIVYDGDVEYTVPRGMDPEMEEDYEKFVAENEVQWLSNHKSTS